MNRSKVRISIVSVGFMELLTMRSLEACSLKEIGEVGKCDSRLLDGSPVRLKRIILSEVFVNFEIALCVGRIIS